MAWADGIIEDSEKRLLKKFVIRFGFHEENSDSIVAFLLESIQKRKNMRDIINDIKS